MYTVHLNVSTEYVLPPRLLLVLIHKSQGGAWGKLHQIYLTSYYAVIAARTCKFYSSRVASEVSLTPTPKIYQ